MNNSYEIPALASPYPEFSGLDFEELSTLASSTFYKEGQDQKEREDTFVKIIREMEWRAKHTII